MSVRLFVGGLSFSTSSEGLRNAFARFGPVQAANVMTDRETGRSRGFGFVEMATSEEADQAIAALNGSSLDGRTIRVDKATPRGAGGPPPRAGGFRPSGGPGGGPRGPSTGGPSRSGPPGVPPLERPERPGGSRRGAGGGQWDRRSGPGRGGGEGKKQSGRPVRQRRSGERGRRSTGEDGGYRWGR